MKKKFFLLFIVFFMTAGIFNCSYMKEEVDSLLNGLEEDISSQKQPVAYGIIDSDATTTEILSGSGNFGVTRISQGYYNVNITGFSCVYLNITVTANIEGGNTPGYAVWFTSGGDLFFYTYNPTGSPTDLIFSFMVWKN